MRFADGMGGKTVRMIDADAAIVFVDAGHLVSPNEPRWSDNEVVAFLKSRPTVDAVEVVRCKDCKYFESEDDCDCPMDVRYSDFFCKMGERRTDG